MEKVERYRQIIMEVLEELVSDEEKSSSPIPVQFIKDHEGGHYMLFSNGWRDIKRVYGCYLHIDIAPDGKVWLQHDGTDLVVGQMLLDKGVAKEDLVLGFHHPWQRVDTGYAVA